MTLSGNKKRLMLVGRLIVLVAASTGVQATSDIHSKGSAQDPVYVVSVDVPDEVHLQALLNESYNVTNVDGLTVTLYLDATEYAAVCTLGYPVQLVEVQPDARLREKADAYTTPEQIGELFSQYAAEYPQLCIAYTLGQSVNGRDLWSLKITENPQEEADKPAVKYISTMHGDEPIGTELCLYLARELLTGYGVDSYITDFLHRTIIWFVPMMNPDGFVNYTRYNANNVDLNRSFPTYAADFTGFAYDGEPLHDEGRQPEIAHIMRWSRQTHFAIAANFHAGVVVVNYPYDYEPGVPSRVEAPSPDNGLFQYISLAYSTNNPPMYSNGLYPQGIVNGSYWYSITGGMQDWNYRYLGCPEVTIELSVIKRPSPSSLEQLWSNNRNAMYAYAEMAHIGIRGLARDRNTDAPVWAKVLVDGNEQPVFSNPNFGNYHRLLLPGIYNASFRAAGYISYYADNIVVSEGPAARVNVPFSDGDINADGLVDNMDIQLTVDAVLGRPVSYDGDVDGRGLSATDIQAVINQKIFNSNRLF